MKTPMTQPCGPFLLLLRVPPPFGGGEIRAEILSRRFGSHPEFEILVTRRRAATRFDQGRLSLSTLAAGTLRAARAIKHIFTSRPKVVFLSLPKGFAAFLWVVPVIYVARKMGSRVCAELAGMRFEFRHRPSQWRIAYPVLNAITSLRYLAHSIREAHRELNGPYPVVFYNGVEAPPPPQRENAVDHLRVSYVGALEPAKGFDVFIDTACLAGKLGLPIEWTAVGEWCHAAYREAVFARLKTVRPEPRVSFPGLLLGKQKWRAYQSADVLLHPSRLDGQPLAILEAMSQGLAIIAGRVGAIPETLVDGRNGRLLDRFDPTIILDTLAEWRADPQRLRAISEQNVEDFKVRFTAERYVRRFSEWLHAVARGEVNRFEDDWPPAPEAPRDDRTVAI